MDIAHLPPRDKAGNIHVVVEIAKGSRNKYEFDEQLGILKLDRPLYSAVHYPTAYGFVPSTRGADDERLDALLLVDGSIIPGCLVPSRLIGMLTMEHQNGLAEQKLLLVPAREPRFAEYYHLADVPQHVLKEIEHFFNVFKQLEEKSVRTLGWEDAGRAEAALAAAIQAEDAHY